MFQWSDEHQMIRDAVKRFVDDEVRARTKLDAIITVVDAKNLPARLADSHEAEDQIAFADVIVLNKMDLVSADEAVAVEAAIRKINKFAKIHHATKSNVPIAELLDQGAFDLNRVLAHTPDFLTDDEHEHNDDIASTVLAFADSWNEFFLALVFTVNHMTAPASLASFSGRYTTNIPLVSAGAVMVAVPILAVFIIFQRQFISALLQGSLKG